MHGALAPLNITGASGGRTLEMRQTLVVTPRVEADLTGGLRRRYSDNWIDGVFLQRTTTTDHHLGMEVQVYGERTRWLGNWTRYWGETRVLSPSGHC